MKSQEPTLTGIPFGIAYRYVVWLLTVPLLLVGILLVMKLSDSAFSCKPWSLGVSSALMIVSVCCSEIVVTG
jgi:bacteriorhodopsin